MNEQDLRTIYRNYIDCLNQRDWASLSRFVADDAVHNGRAIGLSGYRQMLEHDVLDIPDLRFDIELLVIEPPFVASRLRFDCSPRGAFLGLNIDGKRISFTENVFYAFSGGKIANVWSVIDKTAIEAQLAPFLRASCMTNSEQEKSMSEPRPDAQRSDQSAPADTQPDVDEKDKTWRQTDRSRTGEGSGATGGGSFGNLPGEPVTGGSSEFGPNEKRPENPPADETNRERNGKPR
jgi:predicted ester cyclase